MIAKRTLPTLAAALSCPAIMAGMTCAPGVAQTDGRQAEAGGRPNILVIMSDQHSRSFLGCYGNRIVRTPNLDRPAAGGDALQRRLLRGASMRAEPDEFPDLTDRQRQPGPAQRLRPAA